MDRELNLTAYLVIIFVTANVLNWINPDLFFNLFALSEHGISTGFIWQFITYSFFSFSLSPAEIHQSFFNIFFYIILIIIFYQFGSAIEEAWGKKHYLFYLLLSVLPYSLVSFFIGNLPLYEDNGILISILFAFGFLNPNAEILLFFIIPIKVKYIAIFSIILVLIKGIYLFINIPHIYTILLIISPYLNIVVYHRRIFGGHSLMQKVSMRLKKTEISTIKKQGLNLVKKHKFNKFIELKNKIDQGSSLNRIDLDFISSLSDDKPGVICGEDDFLADIDYCRKCNINEKCMIRFLKKNKIIV